ncbi:tetratricopeptide repeat protein [Wenzhouxiangella sediminis]|uniref:tetratricopeptide repeat protein n=1 Tax=Wenzhouxiangella sediminis TaxID=1792836 RepID=UPI0015F2917F|nr:tetratricopeptide repeat protein [Wenzhouxiangella sediminis]
MATRLALVVILLMMGASCTEPQQGSRSAFDVEQPPRFEELEPAIKDQYARLREELDRLHSAGAPEAARGKAWGEMGRWFHIYRYPDSAMLAYGQAARLDPREPRWPYYRGMLAVEAGRLDQAADSFRAAAELAPRSSATRVRLADLWLEQRESGTAEAMFEAALEIDPRNLSAGVGLARIHLQRQQPKAAIERLTPLLGRNDRGDGHIHYLLGQAYRMLGRVEEARTHLAQVAGQEMPPLPVASVDPWLDELLAINLSSNHLTRLGQRAYRQGNYQLSAHHSGRAARLNPDNAELRANYAAALLALGRTIAARRQIEATLRQAPDLARAHLILGGIEQKEGNWLEAENALLHALELDPGMSDARKQLGRLYQRTGQLDKAVESYSGLRTRFSESGQVRFWHAALLTAAGRHREALAALEEDLEIASGNTRLELLRIRLLAAANDPGLRDPRRAEQLLSALSQDSAHVFYAETAAMVAAANAQPQRAVNWERRALAALEALQIAPATQIARRRLVLYSENRITPSPWEREEVLVVKPAPPLPSPQSSR